jgi:integrase
VAEGMAGFHNKRILDKKRQKNGKLDESSPLAQPPLQPCPECNSRKIYRDGLRYLTDGTTTQRWLCRNCGYRFSQQKPLQKNQDWQINTASTLLSKRQVCELLTEESKNLAEVTRQETAQREGTAPTEFDYAWQLKKRGLSETTITCYAHIIKQLRRMGAELFDPEDVKGLIARQENWSQGRKGNIIKAYSLWLKMHGLQWDPPKYKPIQKIPFLPTEAEIDSLIGGSSPQMATFIQLLKETAARCGEAYKLQWIDLDSENNTARITPEKGSNPRLFKLSNKLIAMINRLPRTSTQVFTYKGMYNLRKIFSRQRKRIANKLGNPRILQIHFHTLRHWRATMEYHKTRDILHVMQFLGHRNIKTTLRYTQLIAFADDEYVCRVADNIDQAKQLIESGFDYVTDIDEHKLFRKRK